MVTSPPAALGSGVLLAVLIAADVALCAAALVVQARAPRTGATERRESMGGLR